MVVECVVGGWMDVCMGKKLIGPRDGRKERGNEILNMTGKDRRGEGGMDEGRKGGERGGWRKKKKTGCFRRINLSQGELSYHYRLKPRFFFSLFYSEYVKIIDGSGTTVFTRYSTTPQKPFAEVSFGNSENITVQIYLHRRTSNVRLQFGILQQGLQSG